ncbi:hypothetical protein RF11_06095 [Thelohanellus kitauei]|uniref:Uncharacterized protein n=1 Tax=Thelohanellus kitauei TaxID=669202 RepID=A0A0C2ML65_THEKT|nr:hypothetical protein RF11_06095 [Thelohanellus kitauei]
MNANTIVDILLNIGNIRMELEKINERIAKLLEENKLTKDHLEAAKESIKKSHDDITFYREKIQGKKGKGLGIIIGYLSKAEISLQDAQQQRLLYTNTYNAGLRKTQS